VKDLPDIALLATITDLEALTLAHAIRETFAHRGTHETPPSLVEPDLAWEPVYARMAAADALQWRTLADLVKAVRGFLDPALGGATGRWDPAAWSWRDDGERALGPRPPRRGGRAG